MFQVIHLANKMGDFFTRAISKMSVTVVMTAGAIFEGQHLTHFRPAVQDEPFDVIVNSPSKSYQLDQICARLPTGKSSSLQGV